METAADYATDAWAATRAALPYVVLVGLVAGVLATGGLRLLGGPGRGALLAAGGAALAMTGVLLWRLGLDWPAVEAMNRVPWLAAGALALGFLLAVWGPSEGVLRTIAGIAAALAVWWLAGTPVAPSLHTALIVLVPLAVWGVVLWRMHHIATRDQGLVAHLVAMPAGLAAVAVLLDAGWSAGTAGGVAACAFGQLLWVWDRARFPGNALTVVGAGGTVLALGTALVKAQVVPWPAALLLAAVVFTDAPARALIPAKGVIRGVWAPVAFLLAAAAPVALALGAAYLWP